MTNPQLKRFQHLSAVTLMFGIPLKLFALAGLFAGFGFIMCIDVLGWLFGLPMGALWCALLMLPLRWAHEDDPHAWAFWLARWRVADFSSDEVSTKRRLSIMKEGRVYSYQHWKQKR
ncbi:hypothetical protein [Vibrio chagasii]|uniref:hypothetical protein n=1 Tax=Vibrio chagasii TaxID=170679 RepID=UPI002283337B|nr:hypothetical protein [Vibrio chagasii]MCY9828842.1 hypothetical protein [Vibrio chagasii]